MNQYAFNPPAPPTVGVYKEHCRLPVRRLFCVGRNYAAHAREMGKDPYREPPFFFTKPADAVADTGATIPYPPETTDFQYEIELVVAIGHEGFRVGRDRALDLVFGYGVGIDLTRRDLQLDARAKGRPWDWGKAFDRSAPIAPIRRFKAGQHPTHGRIWLAVNGVLKQDADIAELIWPVQDIISILSRSMVLKPGDLIMTGTPAGVGPVIPADKVNGGIDGLGEIEITVGEPMGSAALTGSTVLGASP